MPETSRAPGQRTSKISMLGWCTVQVMVRPVSTIFLTTLITIAAALASRPAHSPHSQSHRAGLLHLITHMQKPNIDVYR